MCIEGKKAVKVDAAQYAEVFELSQPYPEVKNWRHYDWWIVEKVPVAKLDHSTMDEYRMDPDSDDAESGADRVETIMNLLEEGAELWPVIMGLECTILDGFHRITAADELGIKTIPVIYPLKRRRKS